VTIRSSKCTPKWPQKKVWVGPSYTPNPPPYKAKFTSLLSPPDSPQLDSNESTAASLVSSAAPPQLLTHGQIKHPLGDIKASHTSKPSPHSKPSSSTAY
jgi:hypothetical protein